MPRIPPPADAARARFAGFGLLAPLQDLRVDLPSLDDLFEQLPTIPKITAVQWLAYLAATLHWGGEMEPLTQEAAAHLLFGGDRRTLRRAREQVISGRLLVTYEAVARSVLPVVQFAGPGQDDIGPEEIRLLRALVLRVQEALLQSQLVGNRTRPVDPTAFREEAAFLQFLGAGMAGARDSVYGIAFGGSLGALACRSVLAGRSKHTRKINAELRAAIGLDLSEIRLTMVNILGTLIHSDGRLLAGKDLTVRIDMTRGDPIPDRMRTAVLRVVGESSIKPSPDFDIGLLRAPREAWPDCWRWSPFLNCGDSSFICWDVRGLALVVGAHFARLLRPLLPEGIADLLDGRWNEGIESALDVRLGPALPTWTSPLRAPGAAGLYSGGRNPDRLFVDGDDLFFVEVKNDAVTQSRMDPPTPSGLLQWLEERFFAEEGFTQIYELLAAMEDDATVFGRPVAEYRRIWPIVTTPVRMPVYPHFADALQRLAGRCEVDARARFPRLGPPLILGYQELEAFIASGPQFGSQGLSLGQVLESLFAEREDRPFLLSQFIYRHLGELPAPTCAVETAEAITAEDMAAWRCLIAVDGS